MKFQGTKTWGFENALIGLRLPCCNDYNLARSKLDSTFYSDGTLLSLGTDDLRVTKARIVADDTPGKTGQPESKFLRMIHCQVCITAPGYFWTELDTYKVATVRNSGSKMHKLASTPITIECFEMDDYQEVSIDNHVYDATAYWNGLVRYLEKLRVQYNETHDKKYWKELLRALPDSWLLVAMWDCNYETLRNIASWRSQHKLNEWSGKDNPTLTNFISWMSTLPAAEHFIFS